MKQRTKDNLGRGMRWMAGLMVVKGGKDLAEPLALQDFNWKR